MSENSDLETPAGYAIVADLLERQEVVLTELNSLNDRVEAVIKEISDQRNAELGLVEDEEGNLIPIEPSIADEGELVPDLNQANQSFEKAGEHEAKKAA